MSKKVVICLAAAGFLLALAGSAGAQTAPAGWGVKHIGDGVDGSASMSGTTITITGDGHDIWDNSDGFQFMYKRLTGNGSITARVVSVGTGSNTWAKGGVMIRQDDTAPSADAYMVITSNSDGSAGNGGSFQWRAAANGSCSNTDSTKVVAAPYWVKLERTGNTFNGSYSPDGKAWTQVGTASVTMKDPVLIGLCVTSHAAGELRTMTFDNVGFSGTVADYAPKATKPDPVDGAKEVTSPLFQWTAGETAVMHEVYMGTNPTPGAAEFMGPWPTNMYFHIPGLTPGAKYYWRVDEVDATGAKTTGDVWSFTVQPLEAHNPDPSDGMMGRALNVKLTWAAGQGAVKHKVFVGTDKDKVAAGDASVLAAEQAETSFSPANLAAGATCYWRVDEVDSAGKVAAGPVWSFSTVDPAGGAIAEYWNNNANFFNSSANVLGGAVVVKKVSNVDISWPSGSTKGTNSPDAAINTDYFRARFTAQLNVPVSGKYKLIESTDDGGVLYLNGDQIAGNWNTGGEAENASAELNLEAGKQYILVLDYFENTGGAAARLRWSGPGISKQVIWQGALMPPQCAISPWPVDRGVDVPDSAVLSFTAGPKAIAHTMYFGTDRKKVASGDASVALPPTDKTTYVPAKLDWNTTYYWKVDETAADGTTIPGVVWSFTTANFVVVDPGQKTLNYNNTLAPFSSQIALDVPADLTKNGVTDLVLRFQGQAAAQGALSFDAATGTYSVGGAGSDIWGTTDQFTFAFKALEGDGTMVLRVTGDDKKGANAWSKGGIMIRQSLANNSAYSIMSLTGDTGKADGGNGAAFQWRPSAGASAAAGPNPATWIKPPYFIKLERKGNDFSGYMSETADPADPNAWVQLGTTQTITMTDPVFIGLAVSSHLAGTMRTWTFDSVSTTGNVVPAGPFASWEIINAVQNDPAPLYVAIEDKAGKIAAVTNANPAAVNTTVLDLWRIPMSSFAGVDLANAAKLHIGVGDGTPGGSGAMTFANIRVVKVVSPDPAAVDVTVKGDVVKGFPDYSGAWPAAEYPDLAIDDSITTKYLNFGGKTQPPCGFSVTPALGATVVTGLTFTSANDAVERDPVSWELYGSNAGLNGPWVLVAKGIIDDFAQMPDWPRRWKTVTPIGFANKLAFLNYKVSFTNIKRFTQANSMQIAEVELLGVPAAAPSPVITWVSFHASDAPSTAAAGIGFTAAADKGYTDLLSANGYAVARYLQTGTPDLAVINASSLVIASRSLASSSFQNAAADTWNGVTAPMMILNSYINRKSRLGFNTGNTIPDTTGDITLAVKDPAHPIFAGIALTGDTMTNPFAGIAVYPTDGTKAAGLSIVTEAPTAGGTVLATVSAGSTTGPAGAMVIAEWPAGATVTHDGGAKTNVLGGHRLVFLTGSRESGGKTSETAGMYDLAPDGATMFLNAVQYMLK